MKRIIKMNEKDIVSTALSALKKGEVGNVYNSKNELLFTIEIEENIPKGNKVALRDIEKDEKIIKYGATIGIATKGIKKGKLAHVHNIKSLCAEIPPNIVKDIIRQLDIKEGE